MMNTKDIKESMDTKKAIHIMMNMERKVVKKADMKRAMNQKAINSEFETLQTVERNSNDDAKIVQLIKTYLLIYFFLTNQIS